jgi:signal transduction histidine kinase
LSLMLMGLSPSTAVWWLVWWPMFVAHLMGVVDGLVWVVLALGGAALVWSNQDQHWITPLMHTDDNPMRLMQIGFLLIGAGVSAVVRRAYDRYEEDIASNQRMIDRQNQALESRAVKLEAMLQAVQQSSLERTRLFAQISHEVRTPLNGMLGFAQLLQRTDLSPQQVVHVEQINRCGSTLMQIINDVLDFSRLETHATPLNNQPFNAVQLAHEAVDMVSSIAGQKGVLLVREFPSEEIEAIGDPLRVKQVMLNLLANAVKFTPSGEVSVRCRQLKLDNGAPGLYVEVQDSGIGIPRDAISHLFQPFSQASDATIRQYGGSGLGLAVCKRLVDMMNGRIGVNSEPGQGSLFWFQVPISSH